MKRIATYISAIILLPALAAWAEENPAAKTPVKPAPVSLAFPEILPRVFTGWEKVPGSRLNDSAIAADPANSAVLKEFLFTDFEQSTYKLAGREMTVKVMRFADGTGAFAAFTFYRKPEMAKERFCEQSASDNTRVIFQCANLLVQVELDKVTAMTASDLRSLAEKLPKATGPTAEPPNIPAFLPDELRAAMKYVTGPAGYAQANSPLAAELIDFTRSPEIVVSHFRGAVGNAAGVVIKYPTPKIASLELKKLEDYSRLNATIRSNPSADGKLHTFAVKRVGPLVAVITGEIAETEANNLLDKVHYDAELSWTEATGLEKRNNVGSLLYNMALLSLIMSGFALIIGVVFGGARVLLQRLFPGRFLDRQQDREFISLNLKD